MHLEEQVAAILVCAATRIGFLLNGLPSCRNLYGTLTEELLSIRCVVIVHLHQLLVRRELLFRTSQKILALLLQLVRWWSCCCWQYMTAKPEGAKHHSHHM
jgi:hypothetical protein